MNINKITIKDLVMTGVFAALYFILSWIVGMPLGTLVVTYLAYPFCYALVGGIVTMFFMAKCPKRWLTLIFTILPGIIFLMMGMPPITIVNYLICAILAELARWKSGFKAIKGMKLSHMFISFASMNTFLLIFTAKDLYYQMAVGTMGKAYANAIINLPLWSLFALYASVIIGAIFGGQLGEKVLNKHFKRVGID
ncbi:MptD family putative ECF transporter S component [Facklamia miroungae]|uniref:Energy-coupling factor transport system substrate-specific component n=1 Tax=Facklamia miroungae TaxID=120956 RepID=A0A1G7UB60_9LACT|nr:MptD family putative ECF transporter S component [Facklamia miroungae]NKZ30037.1 MptD family putative ECF transporter S component [Facklamia miroungae]SDG44697.1 energy-coupling factor transport system substrate-specific component [Facklamia miroungae]